MKLIALAAALLLLTSCAPRISVFSDSDPDYKGRKFSSFSWAGNSNVEANRNPLHYNELNDKRIRSAVTKEMEKRGFREANGAELVVHYHIVVEDKSIVTTEPLGYQYGPYWTRMRTNTYSYQEGTLIIDLMDPKTNNLVWRGWATAALDTITPEKSDEMIRRAVEKIFSKFSLASAN